jgi:hypothetical protein
MRPFLLATLLAALATPALAQSGTCAAGGPNGGARATLTGIALGTQMVPRGGTGSDLETVTGIFNNATGAALPVRITLIHRAFQTSTTVINTTLRAGGSEVILGNALRGQITRTNAASAITLDCP